MPEPEASRYRRALAEDRAVLDDMTLSGVRYWGHHVNHPEAYAGLEAVVRAETDPDNHPVFVLEDGSGIVGFFELRDRGDHIELLRMFLRLEAIGHGLGRVLWEEAVAVASQSHDRLLILSDPAATDFYEAMGAVRETEIEVSPGFSIAKLWYDLEEHQPSHAAP